MSLSGESSASDIEEENEIISQLVNTREDESIFPGAESLENDESLENLANEFGTHHLGGEDLAPPSIPYLVNAVEVEDDSSNAFSTSSGKRKVSRDYSGRIDKEEFILRQRNSDQGSFRVAKGTDRQLTIRRSQTTPAVEQEGEFPPHDTFDSSTQFHPTLPSHHSQTLHTAQSAPVLSFSDRPQPSLGASRQTDNATAPPQSPKRGFLSSIKNKVSKVSTILRKSSEKVDGRSSVDRHAAKPRHWTKEEDELLRLSVEQHGEKHWKKIAEQVPGRNHMQCLQRWTKVLAPGLRKGQWSADEDDILIQLATEQLKECEAQGKQPKVSWGVVKNAIPGRTAKQCRERWVNSLNPEIKRGDWTEEEDRMILHLYNLYPQKWAAIAKCLEGRTESAVKIRWKTLTRDDPSTRLDLSPESETTPPYPVKAEPPNDTSENYHEYHPSIPREQLYQNYPPHFDQNAQIRLPLDRHGRQMAYPVDGGPFPERLGSAPAQFGIQSHRQHLGELPLHHGVSQGYPSVGVEVGSSGQRFVDGNLHTHQEHHQVGGQGPFFHDIPRQEYSTERSVVDPFRPSLNPTGSSGTFDEVVAMLRNDPVISPVDSSAFDSVSIEPNTSPVSRPVRPALVTGGSFGLNGSGSWRSMANNSMQNGSLWGSDSLFFDDSNLNQQHVDSK